MVTAQKGKRQSSTCCAAETAEEMSKSAGRGIVPGVLLKLLVKDKLPLSREVPVNVKEWQLLSPEERERRLQRMSTNQHKRVAVETPEEKDYSR